ncbi:hypothetical protein [Sphingomonas sp. AP4-R1]|uniref:hypothetical protein n=1 Tax=Sphingomonas sp. AP4-R1 TaxID=2735134 RepID=UPI001C10E7E1|nr:hypothetical protein [Sphingomonas sp. AP4-R1]
MKLTRSSTHGGGQLLEGASAMLVLVVTLARRDAAQDEARGVSRGRIASASFQP